jgi:EAL domain-containing protein (putative c-di-GMP-specific phosphodiesterase class I)
VETAEQALERAALGYTTAQDHLFGRPMPPDDLATRLAAPAAEPRPPAQRRPDGTPVPPA